MNRFEGRVALVTGGANGLGEASANRLAREGAKVVIWDRDTQALATAQRKAEDAGLTLDADTVDMLERPAIEAAVERVISTAGRLDILVNNVGGSLHVPFRFLEQTDDDWQKVLEVNIMPSVWTARAVLPHMQKAGYGRIVNLGSKAGRFGSLFAGAPYSAAKGAVQSLTLQLAQEFGPDGITCNAVCPGAIITERVDRFLNERHTPEERERIVQSIPVRRQGRVEDVASAIAYLASEEASFVTGVALDVNGGQAMSI
jgi:NAD(P)-dependent dehydrogenase (short-subunit alcohol dehydrogenase family)